MTWIWNYYCIFYFIKCDLNILNDKNMTPLAFGIPEILRQLNLKEGITLVNNKEEVNIYKKKNFDNNAIVNRKRTS